MMESFGSLLRHYREKCDISQNELARLAYWSQSRISRAETNQILPSEHITIRLDQLLKAHGELIKSRRAIIYRRKKRIFPLIDAADLANTFTAVPTPDADNAKWHHITIDNVQHVEHMISVLENQDHCYGGIPVRHMAAGLLQWAYSLVKTPGSDRLRTRLLSAISYLSDLTGWATADAGHPQAARVFFETGIKTAVESQDPGILVHVASGLARLEIHERNPREALNILRRADRNRQALAPTARSMLHSVAALAWAQLSDANNCHKQLELAHSTYIQPTLDDPAWIAYFTPGKLASDRANALYDLAINHNSNHSAVINDLETTLSLLPDSRARNKALCATRLAHIYFLNNEPDPGHTATVYALDLAQSVHSHWLSEEITQLRRTIRKGSDPQRTSELFEVCPA